MTGVLPVTLAAASAASLSSPWILGATLASSGLVLANDHGFLDFMNAGDTRPIAQVERESWQATGIDEKVGVARQHGTAAVRAAYGTARGWVDRVS